jgi:phage terminase small subunit
MSKYPIKTPYTEVVDGVTVIRNAPLTTSNKKYEMTEKQKKFADEYMKTGNHMQAYRNAYNCHDKRPSDTSALSNKLLRSRKIREYIESTRQINALAEATNVLDIKQIRGFWTDIIRNCEMSVKDRLKASELLARSQGMFLDRVEHNMNVQISFDGNEEDWNEIVDADIIGEDFEVN